MKQIKQTKKHGWPLSAHQNKRDGKEKSGFKAQNALSPQPSISLVSSILFLYPKERSTQWQPWKSSTKLSPPPTPGFLSVAFTMAHHRRFPKKHG